MQVSGSFFPNFSGAYFRTGSVAAAAPSRATPASGPSLRDFAKLVIGLRDAFRRVELGGDSYRGRTKARDATAVSATGLSIALAATPTTLRSVEEVNTTPTSYSPTSPAFSGSSTSSPTVGGVYSGANGDTTLTVTATSGGVVGLLGPSFEVRDADSNLVDSISLGLDSAGTVYTLSNGLELSFSSGSVQAGDSFEIEVSATVGSAPNTDNPFDLSGDQGPGFESGVSVTAGSFEVNGETIAVGASDSIQDVLDRITASAAGVTASFDAATETVLLTQDTLGPGADITVGNDSSGFLAAVKLDGAVAQPGTPNETEEAIDTVSGLSGVQSGSFTINGVTLTVDTSVDSLVDLIDRINGSGAGVTALLDGTGKVTLKSSGSTPLSNDDGDTGLFTALGIAEGTVYGASTGRTTRFREPGELRVGLGEFARAFDRVLGGTVVGFGAATASSLQRQLETTLEQVFEKAIGKSGTRTLRSGLGIDLVTQGSRRSLEIDVERLGRQLDRDGGALADFLFAESESDGYDGLVTAVESRLGGVLGTLETLLGPEAAGLNLDLSA